MTTLPPETSAAPAVGERTVRRITYLIPGFGISAGLLAGLLHHWDWAAGIVLGAALAWLNFHWLKRVVSALGERASGGKRTSSAGTVFRFLLRYVLMGLGGYAIFKVSPASLNGLLAGLFLPAVAIVCEAGYEAYVAVRRGV